MLNKYNIGIILGFLIIFLPSVLTFLLDVSYNIAIVICNIFGFIGGCIVMFTYRSKTDVN